jgi:XTP/dITP diphosphohydrolase
MVFIDSVISLKLFPIGKVAFFVTGNTHKFNEARWVLREHKVAAALLKVKPPEIQDDKLEVIAKVGVMEAAGKTNLPVIVEEAGLFIEALNGFPGPYSSYVFQTIGTKGILKLMERTENRLASFLSVVAFSNPNTSPICFKGRVDGRISTDELGKMGFGFDPIFKPLEGKGKTFAQMSIKEKNSLSHRANSMRKFAQWYTSS